MDPKMLPPTIREKRRYIAYEVISDGKIEYGDITEAVVNSAQSLFGDFGLSEMGLWHIMNLYDSEKQRGIIKCAHSAVEKARLAVTAVQMAGETKATINILGVTGTIKNAQQKHLK